MSTRDIERETAIKLRNLGMKIKKRNVKVRNRQVDFLLETLHGGKIAVEVKSRIVGIPDILRVASVTRSIEEPSFSFPGTIATAVYPRNKVILDVAAKNDIAIVSLEDRQNFSLVMSFINCLVDLEAIIKKILHKRKITVKFKDKFPFDKIINILKEEAIIDEGLASEITQVWQIRNKLVHGKKVSKRELEEVILKIRLIQEKLSKKLY